MQSFALRFLLCLCLACAGPVSAGNGDDFSASLFSDIAPLIALFGEQVAKQYLSQSLGFLENVIFACSPLGIITAVTSAIRVGGPLALRALIGRSQEPIVQVELELLRSTSSDVCELWDGRQVVRTLGSPDILELVYDEDGRIYGRDEAMKLRPHRTIFSWIFSILQTKRQPSDIELSELHQLVSQSNAAPNIFLNGGSIHPLEIQLVALIALILQLGVLIFDVSSIYDTHLSRTLGTYGTPSDGLPLTVAGTLAVSAGVFICCCVIEARTRLARWVPRDRQQSLRILWLQKSQNMNGQSFKSCAIFADTSRHEIVASQLDYKRNLGPWSCLGTSITAVGFICQLIGLRTMNYQAAVAQFVATMIMMILRVVIRRHSTPRPVLDYSPCRDRPLNTFGILELDDGHEINELAKRLTGCKEWTVCSGYLWNHIDFEEEVGLNSTARKVLENRLKLKELCGNFQSLQTLADNVGEAIDAIMNYIWTTRLQAPKDDEQLNWSVEVATIGDVYAIAKLDIPLFKSGDKWRVERATIEAILGMWLSQLHDHGLPDSGSNLWLLSFDDDQNCEYSQVLLDLINSKSVKLEPIVDLAEMCRQRDIDYRRVLYSGVTGNSQPTRTRALIGQSDLYSMCAQYMIMAFLSQVAIYIQRPTSPLLLQVEPKSHIIHVQDPIFDTVRSLIQQSGLATAQDSSVITFCSLAKTGKLLDPYSLLPQLVSAAALQNEDQSRQTSSKICQLFRWNAMALASKGLLAEAIELGLSIIGGFIEGFGYQNDETQEIRHLVQEVILAAEFTHQGEVLVDITQTAQTSEKELLGNDRPSSVKALHGGQPREAMESATQAIDTNEVLDENTFKAVIRTGDVGKVRKGLLFDRAEYPLFLSSGMVAAFDATKEDCTFKQTEIIRLLVLSGSGLDFGFRFNISTLLNSAAQAGNVMLAELLLQKAAKNRSQLDLLKAMCTAIEFDHENFVKFLVDFGCDFNMDSKKGTQALRHAAFYGRDTTVKYLISLGANVKGQTNDMDNALSRAASQNHDSLGRFLIEQETSISKGVGFRYQRGETSLHFVAAVGNINLVQALLDAGWDVNAGERDIPLKAAMRYGHEPVVNLLIENGSRLDEGLLHQAAEKGLTRTAKLLISKGADVNALDRQKRPLFEAARQGPKEKYEEFIKLLIDSGAKVDVKDSSGMSVLLQASDAGYESVSKLILEAGASVVEKRTDGTTLVHSAAKKGHVEIIRLLVERGAQLDVRDDNMRTALNFAAGGGHAEAIRLLLVAKPGDWVNGNSNDEYRSPPLHDAILSGRLEAARVLIENGASIADPSFVDWRYSSPLYIAVRNDKAEIVQIFMDMGGGTLSDNAFGEIVKEAVERGHLETIRALLSRETAHPVSGKVLQATQHLPHAALRCKTEIVKLLLELGGDSSDSEALNKCIECSDNPNLKNNQEWYNISIILFLHNSAAAVPFLARLLRTAANHNNVEGVRFWLSHKAPINTIYEGGKTILHHAAAADALECLAVLLEETDRLPPVQLEDDTEEYFINTRSQSGATALHAAVRGVKMYAQSDSHLGVIKMLIAHGADPSFRAREDNQMWVNPNKLMMDRYNEVRREDQGLTALDEARRAGLGLIVKLLEGLSRE